MQPVLPSGPALRVLRERKEQPVWQVPPPIRVLKVSLVPRVPWEPKDPQDFKVLLVPRALKVQRAQPVPQEHRVWPALPFGPVLKVQSEP